MTIPLFTEGGDDSISISKLPSAPTSMATTGDDSISIDGGVVASSVYGAGTDSVWIANGASTAALIDGGVAMTSSLGGLSGTSSLLGGVGEDTITVAGVLNSICRLMAVKAMTPLPLLTLLSAPQLKAAVELTASTSEWFQGLCPSWCW